MKLKNDLPSKDRGLEKVGAFIGDLGINILTLPIALMIGGKSISPLTDKINSIEYKEKQDLFNLECIKFLKQIHPDKEFTNVEGIEHTGDRKVRIKANCGEMKFNGQFDYKEFQNEK